MGASSSKQVVSRTDLQQRHSTTKTNNTAAWHAILGGGGYVDDGTLSMGTVTPMNYQVRSAQMKHRLFQKLTPLEKIIVESN
jgi:hypothetical protein